MRLKLNKRHVPPYCLPLVLSYLRIWPSDPMSLDINTIRTMPLNIQSIVCHRNKYMLNAHRALEQPDAPNCQCT